MAWLYILKGNQSDRYYIGSTDNLVRRLKQHQSGHTSSTQRLGEFSMVFNQEYDTLDKARKIERRLKKLKRKDYIDRIVKDGEIRMKLD